MRKHALLPMIAAGLFVVACDEDPTEPTNDLSTDEIEALAVAFDEISGTAVDRAITSAASSSDASTSSAAAVPTDLVVIDIEFERSRSCPAGGTAQVEGTMHRERDTEAHSITVDVEGTGTKTDCAVRGPRGVLTVNGTFTHTAHRMRVGGQPTGLQTMTHEGSFTWERNDGASGECEVSFNAELDPENGTRTVTGTFCGREFSRTVTWTVDVSA